MNVLVTGATGNVGLEVIEQLIMKKSGNKIVAGVRNVERAKSQHPTIKEIDCVLFDFEEPRTLDLALAGIDIIFLLRPPQIANIKKYFGPLIATISRKKISKIVFLSVQGAEASTLIPHRKIELAIIKSGIDYVFLRPSYFMQNLTTTLAKEIKIRRSISLPSADAKFNWVDIHDIAELAVEFIEKFDEYKNRSFTISGRENLNFETVVKRINAIASTNISYHSVGPFGYWKLKKEEGLVSGMIMVTFLLHFLPRMQKEPEIVNSFKDILKKAPGSLNSFIARNVQFFT